MAACTAVERRGVAVWLHAQQWRGGGCTDCACADRSALLERVLGCRDHARGGGWNPYGIHAWCRAGRGWIPARSCVPIAPASPSLNGWPPSLRPKSQPSSFKHPRAVVGIVDGTPPVSTLRPGSERAYHVCSERSSDSASAAAAPSSGGHALAPAAAGVGVGRTRPGRGMCRAAANGWRGGSGIAIAQTQRTW